MPENIPTRSNSVPEAKLWFGFTGCAAAWIALAAGDVLITWWACTGNQAFRAGGERPVTRVLYVLAAILLIGTAAIAGVVSYRNWRQLSDSANLQEAEGQGRQEFMALLGVFVSATLGMGLIWLTVPLFLLQLCVRAR